MTEWESISTGRSNFIGWGTEVGQFVEGKVVSYTETGGMDANNNPCPEILIELTLPAASFIKGVRTNYEVGTVVTVTCGLKSLKRDIAVAQPSPGDLVRLELVSLVPTSKGNPAKIVDTKIKRNGQPSAPPEQASFGGLSPKPPF